jgi:hypothetical protein
MATFLPDYRRPESTVVSPSDRPKAPEAAR